MDPRGAIVDFPFCSQSNLIESCQEITRLVSPHVSVHATDVQPAQSVALSVGGKSDASISSDCWLCAGKVLCQLCAEARNKNKQNDVHFLRTCRLALGINHSRSASAGRSCWATHRSTPWFSWEQHRCSGFVLQIGCPKSNLQLSYFIHFHEEKYCRSKQDEYPEHKQR